MTGAAIVRWQAEGAVVLAVHGAFDGASAWALRVAMDESPERRFVVDLTHAVEACDFAASVLAAVGARAPPRQWAHLPSRHARSTPACSPGSVSSSSRTTTPRRASRRALALVAGEVRRHRLIARSRSLH